ncbi:hypothetical protein CTI14_60555 [Methylobacterium radiotolerans]|nr:hypothetical protein CTI14_60555 [Methylobacterium radiotolerans]
MRWILIRAGAVLGRGSRETVLTLAEHHGLVWHATSGRSPEPGRGYLPTARNCRRGSSRAPAVAE